MRMLSHKRWPATGARRASLFRIELASSLAPMPKRKRGNARAELARALEKARIEREVREKAHAAEMAEKGNVLWPMFLGGEREPMIVEFFGQWTPERVLAVWRAELAAYGLDAATVVYRILVSRRGRSKVAGGHPPSGTAWWRRTKLMRLQTAVVQWLEENPELLFVPDTAMRPGMVSERKGLAQTVESLGEVPDDPQRIGAVLISASLFSRFVSSRGFLDWKLDRWVGKLLYNWMLRFAEPSWHHASAETLPLSHDGFGADIQAMEQLIGILALEHARVLHAYVPVCVKFVDEEPPPLLRLI